MYVLTACMLGMSAYLHSPVIASMTVMLWGLEYAHSAMTMKGRDAEITGLILRMEKLEKRHTELTMDISNVAERAKTILGEVY